MANKTTADIQNLRGKIGIGTNNPFRKLHVVSQSGETETLVIEGSDSLGKQLILGYNATGNGYGTIQTVYQGTAFTNLSINSSGGNVGIGTTSPSTKLDVFDSSTTAENTIVAQAIKNYVGGSAMFRVGLNAGNTTADIEMNSGGAGPFRYGSYGEMNIVNNRASSKINFVNSASIAATIDSLGRVGIGTTAPAHRLDVDGLVMSQDGLATSKFHRTTARYQYSNGYLIATNNAVSDNNMLQLEITGNTYSGITPLKAQYQLYNYVSGGSIIRAGGISTHPDLTVDVFHYNGYVYFWLEQTSGNSTLTFDLYSGLVDNKLITAVSNAAKPTTGVTNSVTITPRSWWTSDNDGSGSGLDADLLDGLEATAFATSAQGTKADTAHGWGDHSTQNYLKGSNSSGTYEGTVTDWNSPTVTGFYSDDNATNRWSGQANWTSIMHVKLYDDNNSYATQIGFNTYNDGLYTRTNVGGAWTSWKEIYHSGVFTNNSSNWDTAYGWGSHASAGYLTTASAASTYAPLASPALTGTPTAPTAGSTTNNTQLATTAFVQTAVSNLVDSAPGTLDTLNELAAALGDDANFSTTMTTALGNRLRIDTNAQGLNATQQANGRTNLGLGTAATSASTDFVAVTGGTMTGNLTVSSGTSGDSIIIIESDTDNNNEDDNPQLHFKQDGGLVNAYAGLVGNADTIFTNSLTNAAYFGTVNPTPLQLFTNGISRLTIKENGYIKLDAYTAGILKTDANGDVSVDTSTYLTSVAFSDLTSTPTTIAGYGITDAFDGAYSSLTGTPLTLPTSSTLDDVTDNGSTTTNGITVGGLSVNGSTVLNGGASNLAAFVTTTSSFGAAIAFEDSSTNGNDVVHCGAIGTGFYAAAGGSERLRIIANGNVGIGTANPLTPLHVSGSAFIDSGFLYMSDALPIAWGAGNVGIEGNSATKTLQLRTNGQVRLHIASDGNVGLGSTNPQAKLHVAGSVRIDDIGTTPNLVPSGPPAVAIGTKDPSKFMAEPDQWLKINIAGVDYVIPAYLPA